MSETDTGGVVDGVADLPWSAGRGRGGADMVLA